MTGEGVSGDTGRWIRLERPGLIREGEVAGGELDCGGAMVGEGDASDSWPMVHD